MPRFNGYALVILLRSSLMLFIALLMSAASLLTILEMTRRGKGPFAAAIIVLTGITGFCFKCVNWPHLKAAAKNVFGKEP